MQKPKKKVSWSLGQQRYIQLLQHQNIYNVYCNTLVIIKLFSVITVICFAPICLTCPVLHSCCCRCCCYCCFVQCFSWIIISMGLYTQDLNDSWNHAGHNGQIKEFLLTETWCFLMDSIRCLAIILTPIHIQFKVLVCCLNTTLVCDNIRLVV